MCRDFDLMMESNTSKALTLMQAFISEEDLGQVLNYKDEVMAITTEDIKRVAKQYLTNDYLAIYIEKGKLEQECKNKKPGTNHRTACRQTIFVCYSVQEYAISDKWKRNSSTSARYRANN